MSPHRKIALAVAVAMAIFDLAAAGPAWAQSYGSLDPAFNGSGVITTSSSQLLGVAVQSNGDVVVGGQSGGDVFVERFTPAGAADGSYTGPAGVARAVAVQSDGDIVLAGATGSAMLVERLTPSLTPDTSFGSGGIATAFAGDSASANSVAIGADGTVVAAGLEGTGAAQAAAFAEFTSGGAPDTSFAGSGAEALGFGGYGDVQGLAVQGDGKIVFAGSQSPSPYQVTNAVLGRLNTDGGLDTSFAGGSGVLTYHYPGGGYTSFQAVALQNNGDIVVAGAESGGPNALFLRYDSSGDLDSSFGSSGVTAVPAAGSGQGNTGAPAGAQGVGIAGGGRIVGAGPYESSGVAVDAAAWGLTATGAPDSTFGTDGVTLGPTSGGLTDNYEACALAIAPDGTIVAAGDMPKAPDDQPCATGVGTGGGFVAEYVGDGPPPSPLPASAAPSVTTGTASTVTETSATLTGQVNPNGLSTSYFFDYGTSEMYGSTTATFSAGSGTTQTPVSAGLTGLEPGTTYHYRLVATNSDGTTDGADQTLTTSAATTAVSTGAASGVSEVSATLKGAVDTGGLATTWHFDYGKSSSYGSSTPSGSLSASATTTVSALLKNLKPGTTYHYRLVASNAKGTVDGADHTFKTLPKLRSQLHGVKSSYALATISKSGLTVKIGCTQPCSISGTLLISAASAKALKLGTHETAIATGSASLAASGTTSLVLKLTKSDKSAVSKQTQLTVTLRTVSKPTGGGPSVTNTRTITLTS